MLDSSKLSDWLQVIGLFSVLGGLIFVGLQLRLDRQIALSEGVAVANDARMYWAELLNEYSEVWVKGLAGEPMSLSEQAEFTALANAWELTYFTSWNRAVQLGTQPARRFPREAALDFYTYPGLMNHWLQHQERLTYTNPEERQSDDWLSAVNEEIRKLQARDKQNE